MTSTLRSPSLAPRLLAVAFRDPIGTFGTWPSIAVTSAFLAAAFGQGRPGEPEFDRWLCAALCAPLPFLAVLIGRWILMRRAWAAGTFVRAELREAIEHASIDYWFMSFDLVVSEGPENRAIRFTYIPTPHIRGLARRETVTLVVAEGFLGCSFIAEAFAPQDAWLPDLDAKDPASSAEPAGEPKVARSEVAARPLSGQRLVVRGGRTPGVVLLGFAALVVLIARFNVSYDETPTARTMAFSISAILALAGAVCLLVRPVVLVANERRLRVYGRHRGHRSFREIPSSALRRVHAFEVGPGGPVQAVLAFELAAPGSYSSLSHDPRSLKALEWVALDPKRYIGASIPFADTRLDTVARRLNQMMDLGT